MDIEANLKRQREIVAEINGWGALERMDDQTDLLFELAELVDAMHGWLDGKGFLPQAWRRA